MRYATYLRQPRGRKFTLHSVVDVAGERLAYRDALRTLPRGQGSVEQFPISDGFRAPTEIASTGITIAKRDASNALVAESMEAATAIVRGGFPLRKFDAGTDYGLALAVQRILRDQGKSAFMSKSFMLFGVDSSKYEVSVF